MIQELIYTSARGGLKPGSKGYCTVACSHGMPKPLTEKLESLSGYRHLFPPGHAKAQHNPVNRAYLTAEIGGQRCHILSRVADAGLDYSGRSNKIAHHVVMASDDLIDAGPACCLDRAFFHAKEWEGPPRILPPRRQPDDEVLAASPCPLWKRIGGDAAWARFLIDRVRQGRIVYVLYPLGVDPLPLLIEAQSLLSPSERWRMTFSTYFTRLPPGVECLVRCVPLGSPEAKAVEQRPDRCQINLGKPAPAPRESRVSPGKLATPSERPPQSPGGKASDAAPVDLNVGPPELPDMSRRFPGVAGAAKLRGGRPQKSPAKKLLSIFAAGALLIASVAGSWWWLSARAGNGSTIEPTKSPEMEHAKSPAPSSNADAKANKDLAESKATTSLAPGDALVEGLSPLATGQRDASAPNPPLGEPNERPASSGPADDPQRDEDAPPEPSPNEGPPQ